MEEQIIGLWGGRKRLLHLHTCEVCNKNFYARILRGKRARFCSRECYKIGITEKIECTCSMCGKKFKRIKSKIEKPKHGFLFCSRECKEKAQGVDSPIPIKPYHYKDGYTKYRARAFSEYGKKCQMCGYCDDERMLDVHHIDKNRSHNKIENLAVLCVWCHALVTRGVRDLQV